jgi:hypothetical protein
VSAAVPAAELTCRFGDRDTWYWRRHMGLLCDPLAVVDLYALEHDEHGGCHLRDRQLVIPVCIYVAVDDAGACLYIGQCHRPAGSVVQRIDSHHAIPSFATGLWVLPVRPDCPKPALDRVERRMIRAYHPPYNTAHCPQTFRVTEPLR